MTYDYYLDGASYGLPGDLKTVVTQEWDAATEDWVGDDTDYFRYHTEDDLETGAVEHGLKRVLLPNAYAGFVAVYGDPDDPENEDAGDGQSDPIANYTCFYYEYNADRRVAERIVFGKSNETDYTVSLSTASRTANTWDRKTVETRLDGSTETVYANFRGQPILTDLYDPASETPRSATPATTPTGASCWPPNPRPSCSTAASITTKTCPTWSTTPGATRPT
ncbi:MAG: hypothetical protein M5R36_27155 [Deltaproteobacteria bacterium]|nr:hypothetical protein [Deltaproteobacteria bacterium]